jgi:soluble cytochrome b562
MKIRSTLALLPALLVLSPVISAAADTPAAPPPPTTAPAVPAAAPDTEKKTELEMRMDRIGKAFRKLKKQVADPAQNASSLDLLTKMEDAAKEAIDLTPEKAADLPEDQRAKFEDDFKAGIRGLQDIFAKLREALTAGKNDDAVKIVSDLGDYEKKEHKEFRKPKDN